MSRSISRGLLAGVCVFVGFACAPEAAQEDDDEAEIVESSQQLTISQNPALQLAAYGHGKAVDTKGAELKLTVELVKKWHAAMRADIVSATGNKFSSETTALIKETDVLLAKQEYNDAQKEVLLGGLIWRLLREAPAEMVKEFVWRNNVMISVTARNLYLPPPYSDLLRRLGYTDLILRLPQIQSSYMKSCKEAGVPVPPDWKESGTAWVRQGELSFNMLEPGRRAYVYTWRDPSIAGGCVALPRGDGSEGNFAGIICQNANNGRACFWDNNLRSDPMQVPIGWKRTLQLAFLNDGSTLNAACTDCHTGKNVFLMTPDDPTWTKLMRAPGLDGGTGSFTTRVNASSDNSHGYPRYVPLTTTPPRVGWENVYRAPVCSGGCHEAPSPRISAVPGTMPPACGTSCSTF